MRSTAILLTLTISALTVGVPQQAKAYPPYAPSNFRSTFVNNTSVRLEWVDNSTNESGFKIFMGEYPSSPQLIQTLPAGTRQYTVTGLRCQITGGQAYTYNFQLAATNGDGDTYADNTVTATTLNCLVDNPVKVAGWIKDFWGRGINGAKVQYYQGGQLLGTATSKEHIPYDGYFAMDVQLNSGIRLVASTPAGCYNFNTLLDFVADEPIVPTVPGEFPTIQSTGVHPVRISVQYLLTDGTCNYWNVVAFMNKSLSVWEYKADNTSVHRTIQDPYAGGFFDFDVDCNSDIDADLKGFPDDARFTPISLHMDDITSYKQVTVLVDVPPRTVKGKLLAPDGISPLAGVTLDVDWGDDCGEVSIVTQADGSFQCANGPNRPLTWGYEKYMTSMYPGMSETYIHFVTAVPQDIIDLGTCPILTNVEATCDSPKGAGLDATGFYYQNRCRVTWATNFPTSSQVTYQEIPNPYTTCDYSVNPNQCWITTPEIVTPTTNHQVYIDGLKQNTRYAVRAISGSSRGPLQIVTTKSAFTDISHFTFHQSLTEDEPPQVLVTCGFNTGMPASCGIQIRKHQLNPLKFGTAATTESTADPHGTDHAHDFTDFVPWGSQTPTHLAPGTQYDLVITAWPDHWFPSDPAAPNAQYPDGYNGYTATQVYLKFTTPRTDGTGGHDPEFTEGLEEDPVVRVPEENLLLANSPNPVISTTTIGFYVKEDIDVRLDVYDIQGRLVSPDYSRT